MKENKYLQLNFVYKKLIQCFCIFYFLFMIAKANSVFASSYKITQEDMQGMIAKLISEHHCSGLDDIKSTLRQQQIDF